jgi:RNA polymerase subunit RPABC4/transcription elongation factor Spt4
MELYGTEPRICGECYQELPIDDLIGTSDVKRRMSISCVHCYREKEHEYSCEDCDRVFWFTGIPIRCPLCNSVKITTGFRAADILIEEEQTKAAHRVRDAAVHSLENITEKAFVSAGIPLDELRDLRSALRKRMGT